MQTPAGQNHIAFGENRNTSYAVHAKRLLAGQSMNVSEIYQTLRNFWNRQTEMTKWKALAATLAPLAVAVPDASPDELRGAVCMCTR